MERQAGVDLPDLEPVRPDRGLGGAAKGGQAHVRRQRAQACRQVQWNPVTAEHGPAQRCRQAPAAGCRMLDQHRQQGRHRIPDGDAIPVDQVQPVRGIAHALLVGQDHGAAPRQHAEDIVDGQVEAQRRDAEHAIVRRHAQPRVDVFQRVAGGPVRDRHALGCAGRAGGVDDVGQRIESGRYDVFVDLPLQIGARVHGRHGRWRHQPRDGAGARRPRERRLCDKGGLDTRTIQNGLHARRGHVAGQWHQHCARRDDADRGGERGHAFGHGAGDQVAGHDTRPAQRAHVRQRVGCQPGIGLAGMRGGTGQRVRLRHRLPEEARVQWQQRQRLRCPVDGFAHRALRGGQCRRHRLLPVRGILRQMVESPAIGLEHRIDHARGEQIVDHDPVEFQRALADHHLVVEPDLRRAGVQERGLAEQVRAADQHVEIHAQEAGEHDRHQAAAGHAAVFLRAVAGQFAQDFHAAAARVRQARPELGLGGGGTLRERQRRVAIDREQQHRGEIADQPVDIRMHAAAVEVREVEREAAIVGPARQDFRERSEQHGRAG